MVYFGWSDGLKGHKSARKIDDGDVDEDDGFLNYRKQIFLGSISKGEAAGDVIAELWTRTIPLYRLPTKIDL